MDLFSCHGSEFMNKAIQNTYLHTGKRQNAYFLLDILLTTNISNNPTFDIKLANISFLMLLYISFFFLYNKSLVTGI